MKTLYLLVVMALFASVTHAQEMPTPAPPAMLTVETSITSIDKSVVTVERCETSIGDNPIGIPTESELSRRKTSQLIASITTSEAAVVTAFNDMFEPQTVSQMTVEGEFATATEFYLDADPGRYLLLVNTGAKSAVAVVVIPPTAEPVPDPVDPVDPPADVAALAQLSADLANRISDQPTRDALGASLSQPIAAEILGDAKTEIQGRVQAVLAARQGESRTKDWLNDWRRPIQLEIQRIGVLSLSDYVAAIKAVSTGLLSQPEGSIASVKVTGPAPSDSTLILSALQPEPQYELVPVLVKRCRPDGTCYQDYEYHQMLKE